MHHIPRNVWWSQGDCWGPKRFWESCGSRRLEGVLEVSGGPRESHRSHGVPRVSEVPGVLGSPEGPKGSQRSWSPRTGSHFSTMPSSSHSPSQLKQIPRLKSALKWNCCSGILIDMST